MYLRNFLALKLTVISLYNVKCLAGHQRCAHTHTHLEKCPAGTAPYASAQGNALGVSDRSTHISS